MRARPPANLASAFQKFFTLRQIGSIEQSRDVQCANWSVVVLASTAWLLCRDRRRINATAGFQRGTNLLWFSKRDCWRSVNLARIKMDRKRPHARPANLVKIEPAAFLAQQPVCG